MICGCVLPSTRTRTAANQTLRRNAPPRASGDPLGARPCAAGSASRGQAVAAARATPTLSPLPTARHDARSDAAYRAHGADLRDHRHFSTNAGSPWATHTSCTDHGTSRSGSAPAGWMTQECGPDLVHLSPRHAVRVQSRTSTKADSRERDLFPAAGARPSPSRVPAASTWQLGSFATWVGVCLGRRTAGRRMRT